MAHIKRRRSGVEGFAKFGAGGESEAFGEAELEDLFALGPDFRRGIRVDANAAAGDGLVSAGGFAVIDDIAEDFAGLSILPGRSEREVEATFVTAGAEGPLCAVVGEEELGHLSEDIRVADGAEVTDDESLAQERLADAMAEGDEEVAGPLRVLDAGEGSHVGEVQDVEVSLDDVGALGAVEVEGIGEDAIGEGCGEAWRDIEAGEEERLGEDNAGGAASGVDESEIGGGRGCGGMLIDDEGDAAGVREGVVVEGGLGIDEGDIFVPFEVGFAKGMDGDAEEFDHGAVFDAADDAPVGDAGFDVEALLGEILKCEGGGECIGVRVIVCEDEERGE
jgi:hypothetical protein